MPIEVDNLRRLKIRKEDLVRTGWMKKYNIALDEVIHDVEIIYQENPDGTSGTQSFLRFYFGDGTYKDIQVGVGGGVGGVDLPIPATEVTYLNEDVTNVQEALDKLLYTAPTLSINNSIASIQEVGGTSLSFTVTATATKKSKDIDYLSLSGPGGAYAINNNIANGGTVSLPSNAVPGAINQNAPITYTWTAQTRDTKTPPTTLNQSTTLRFVYPIFSGSLTYNMYQQFLTNGIVGVQNEMATRITQLTKHVELEPANKTVDHGTESRFTYFLIPNSYGALTGIFDGNFGLPYGFETHDGQNTTSDWKEIIISLTTSRWSGQSYRLYVSKTQKMNLKVRYQF